MKQNHQTPQVKVWTVNADTAPRRWPYVAAIIALAVLLGGAGILWRAGVFRAKPPGNESAHPNKTNVSPGTVGTQHGQPSAATASTLEPVIPKVAPTNQHANTEPPPQMPPVAVQAEEKANAPADVNVERPTNPHARTLPLATISWKRLFDEPDPALITPASMPWKRISVEPTDVVQAAMPFVRHWTVPSLLSCASASLPWQRDSAAPELVFVSESTLPQGFVLSEIQHQEVCMATLPWGRNEGTASPATDVAVLPWGNAQVNPVAIAEAELPRNLTAQTPLSENISQPALPWTTPVNPSASASVAVLPWNNATKAIVSLIDTAEVPWQRAVSDRIEALTETAELPKSFAEETPAAAEVSSAALPWDKQAPLLSQAAPNVASLPWDKAVLQPQRVDGAELPWKAAQSGDPARADIAQASVPWDKREAAVPADANTAVLPFSGNWSSGVRTYVPRAELPWDLYLGIEHDSSL